MQYLLDTNVLIYLAKPDAPYHEQKLLGDAPKNSA